MTLRILHILDHSLPLHSGYVFRTLSILREQRKLGWETFHLTSPRQGIAGTDEETVDGWHFYRTRFDPERGPQLPGIGELRLMAAMRNRIAEVVERVQPHVLHPHSPVLNALPAIRVGKKYGLPVVYEMRASWEDAAVDHGTTREGSVRYRLSRALETRAMKLADHVTTICEGLRNDITARGIPAEKVTVIPNAVDTESFRFGGVPDGALRARLGLDNSVVLGFAGSFYSYEGLDLLLDAVPKLLGRYPNLCVLLVGGGPQDDALRSQAVRLGIQDRIVFVGRVPQARVQAHYDLIDVLVYPRRSMRLTELVTPLKPLEAMAQGRLLVASDVGGHRELIRDGETGRLFPAGSADALAAAVSRLLDDRSDWDRIRRAGRHFVESERNWTRSIARYVDVYRRVLPQARRDLAAVAQA